MYILYTRDRCTMLYPDQAKSYHSYINTTPIPPTFKIPHKYTNSTEITHKYQPNTQKMTKQMAKIAPKWTKMAPKVASKFKTYHKTYYLC